MGHMPAIPASTRSPITLRLLDHAEKHWPQLDKVQIACRSAVPVLRGKCLAILSVLLLPGMNAANSSPLKNDVVRASDPEELPGGLKPVGHAHEVHAAGLGLASLPISCT
jgi:hypothetical protein